MNKSELRAHIEHAIDVAVFLVLMAGLAFIIINPAKATETGYCKHKATQAKIIKEQYEKATRMETIAVEFPPRSEMRELIFSVYRGEADNVTPDELYESTYDLCKANEQ